MGFEGMKKAVFWKWLVLVCLIGAGLTIAGWMGFFAYVAAVDITKLSFIILAAFIYVSGRVGWLSYKAIQDSADTKALLQELEIAWFASSIFSAVGLFGTIIGFTLLMSGSIFAGVTAATIPTVIVAALSKVGIALTTTLFGIGSSILTKLQAYNLEHSLLKRGN
jgi:hypothetical protein